MFFCKRVLIAGMTVMMVAGGGAGAQDKSFAPVQAQAEINLSDKNASVKAPLIVEVKPTADLLAAFARVGDSKTSIQLSVQALAPKPDEWTGFQVFLNVPKSRKSMTAESPHYVGSVAFYGDNEGEAVTFTFDLGQTIEHLKRAKLWQSNKPLMLTLVGVPGNGPRKRPPTGIVIRQVSVSNGLSG